MGNGRKKNGKKHQYDISQSLQSHLRFTARVALSVSLLATVVLLGTLYFLLDEPQKGSYFETMHALALSQDQLTLAMLLGGGLIILIAGILTWFITLYSSARIAGPLHRFSKNIEMEIKRGPVPIIKLRKADRLQELSTKMESAVSGLNQYYGNQLQLVDELYRDLEEEGGVSSVRYQELLLQLKDKERSTLS